jgi:hypothetical protein
MHPAAIRGAWGSINWRRRRGSELRKQKTGTPKFTLDIGGKSTTIWLWIS